jgi:hypothetical protein
MVTYVSLQSRDTDIRGRSRFLQAPTPKKPATNHPALKYKANIPKSAVELEREEALFLSSESDMSSTAAAIPTASAAKQYSLVSDLALPSGLDEAVRQVV